MRLVKTHGSLNEIFALAARPADWDSDTSLRTFVRAVCDRESWTGGSDGIYLYDPSPARARAWFFNPDGSSAEFCGNGMRGLGRLILDLRGSEVEAIASGGRDYTVRRAPSTLEGVRQVLLELPELRFPPPPPPPFDDFTAVTVPNPHVVAIVSHYSEPDLIEAGKRANETFPEGANVSFLLPIPPPLSAPRPPQTSPPPPAPPVPPALPSSVAPPISAAPPASIPTQSPAPTTSSAPLVSPVAARGAPAARASSSAPAASPASAASTTPSTPASPGVSEVFVRTFERGAGLTPSCGSGVVASRAVYSRVTGLDPGQRLVVRNTGGVAAASIRVRDGAWFPVLEGNATVVYHAEVDPSGRQLSPIEFAADENAAYAALDERNTAYLKANGVTTAHP